MRKKCQKKIDRSIECVHDYDEKKEEKEMKDDD
jgi:hypothetical protein